MIRRDLNWTRVFWILKELLRLWCCTVVNYCCGDKGVVGTIYGRKDLGSQFQRVTIMVRRLG